MSWGIQKPVTSSKNLNLESVQSKLFYDQPVSNHEVLSPSLSFIEALKTTLASHPSIESLKQTIYSNEALSTSLWQEYLPKIYGYVDAEKVLMGLPKTIGPQDKKEYFHTSVGLSTNLWDGFKNWYLKKQTDLQVEGLGFQKAQLENELSVKLTEAYAGLYLSLEQIRLLKFTQDKEKQILKLIEGMSRSTHQELLKNLITVKLEENEGELLDAESRLQEQKNLFISLVGEMPAELENLQLENLEQIEKYILIPASVDEALELATLQSPEYLNADKEIDIAQMGKKIEKAEYFGNLNLFFAQTQTFGNANFSNPTFADGFIGALQYNLSLGLSTQSKIKSQEHNVASKIAAKDALAREIQLEIKNGYVKMNQLVRANQAQLKTFHSNSDSIKSGFANLNPQKLNIDELKTLINLLDDLEPNTMTYLGTTVEIVLAKATIAAKLGALSQLP
jgi:outer membrane protein TolC